MKNLKIGIKLIGEFFLTALIILTVGLLSIVQQGNLAKEHFASFPIIMEIRTEWQDFNSHISKRIDVNNQVVELSKNIHKQQVLTK